MQSRSAFCGVLFACTVTLLPGCASKRGVEAIRAGAPGDPAPVRAGLWQVSANLHFEPGWVAAFAAVSGRSQTRDYPLCLTQRRALLPMQAPASDTLDRDCRGERGLTQAGWWIDERCTDARPAVAPRPRADGSVSPEVPAQPRETRLHAHYWRSSELTFSGSSRVANSSPRGPDVGMTIIYEARFVSDDCGEVKPRAPGKFGEP
jgi:hypothetical protein